jgi:hypothetical protein
MTKTVDKSESARKYNAERKAKGMIGVWVTDLEKIAGMRCENPLLGEKVCDEADDRLGSCNICWASRWAKQQLERAER